MEASLNNKPYTLIVAGGGTGGHVLAGIAIADAWRQAGLGNVLFVGAKNGIEERLVPKNGYPLTVLNLGALKGLSRLKKLKTLIQIPFALCRSFVVVLQTRPQAVIGVGGYASGPLVLAAKLLGVKTAIVEQNAAAGLTNRILGRLADRVFLAFPGLESLFGVHKTEVTGNPVRASLQAMPSATRQPFTIFIFGGSQGALGINSLVLDALPQLNDIQPQLRWIHQTGVKDFERVKMGYEKAGISARVEKFIDDMPACYSAASLLICRAGSGTLSEIARVGRASVLIPFPHATDQHQEKNASVFVQRNAALLLRQGEATGADLAQHIRSFFEHPEKLDAMENAVKQLAHHDAAGQVVLRLKELTQVV